MGNLYKAENVSQWQEEKTMEHASGIWGRDYMLQELGKIIKPNDTIVDLGSGAGYPTAKMAELAKDGKVIGVEFSKSMLGIEEDSTPISKKYEKIQNLSFINGDAQEVPIASESSALVTSFMVLHNLTLDQIKKVFAETARILKPGGKSIHLTMHPDIFDSEWDMDFMKYDKNDLENLNLAEEKEGVKLEALVKNAGGGEKRVGMYYHTFENLREAAKEAGLKIVNEEPLFVDEKTAKEKFGTDSVGKIPDNPAFVMITLEKINSPK